MHSPIGHTFMYNIIILFVVIVFAFIAGTLTYYKAFKVNNRIVSALEKYEGYNDLSKAEIDRFLGNIGYMVGDSSHCADELNRRNVSMTLVSSGLNNHPTNNEYRYCIYLGVEEPGTRQEVAGEMPFCRRFFTYGVTTYMTLDLPFVNMIRIPIFTRTNRIYKFTTDDTCTGINP